MNPSSDYNYISAGFDSFFNRSIDKASQINLDSQGVQSQSIAYDRTQVTGMLGDTFKIGKISLNGSEGNIIISDGNNDRLLLGDQTGGF